MATYTEIKAAAATHLKEWAAEYEFKYSDDYSQHAVLGDGHAVGRITLDYRGNDVVITLSGGNNRLNGRRQTYPWRKASMDRAKNRKVFEDLFELALANKAKADIRAKVQAEAEAKRKDRMQIVADLAKAFTEATGQKTVQAYSSYRVGDYINHQSIDMSENGVAVIRCRIPNDKVLEWYNLMVGRGWWKPETKDE